MVKDVQYKIGLAEYIRTDLSVTTPTEYILNLKHAYRGHYYL
jgi:hypothetical protein